MVEDYAPRTLEALVPESGMWVESGFEAGSEIFDSIQVTRDPGSDSFTVIGNVDLDMAEGVGDELGVDVEDAYHWLNEHHQHVDAYLDERYDARLDVAFDTWDSQRLQISREVACDATETDALTAVEDHGPALALSDDLAYLGERGRFYSALVTGVRARKQRADRTLSMAEAALLITDHYLAGNISAEDYAKTQTADDAAREHTEHLLTRWGAYLDTETEQSA
ncbi:hypothetical protein [Nocardioides pakistanensis]